MATGAWVGALLSGSIAFPLLLRRLGREGAWPSLRLLMPLLDLLGTWLGTLSAAALLLGRRGFEASWAGALTLVALMVTLSLYDRAVLMPSFEAAFQRLPHAGGKGRWERDWEFLYRLAAGMRIAALLCGLGVLALAA
jgi:hypothetical protein